MASTTKREIRLANMGGDRLEVSLQSGAPWVQVIPGPYILGPGQRRFVSIQVNTGKLLRVGAYNGEIRVSVGGDSFVIKVGLEIVPPFILDPADPDSGVASVTEITRYCDRNWKAATRLMGEGRLEACLVFLGETEAQAALRVVRVHSDPNIALEIFLRTIDPRRGRRLPQHNGSQIEARLGFGLRGWQLRSLPDKLPLYIRNPNRRGYLWGEAHPLVDWLVITPKEFGCAPGKTARLVMKLDSNRLSRRKHVWSLRTGLYEIILLDENGQSGRRVRKAASPGYGIFFSVGITVLLIWIIVVIMFTALVLGV